MAGRPTGPSPPDAAVAAGLSVRSHAPAHPGEILEVITRIRELSGVRSVWAQEIREMESQQVRATAEVAGVFTAENGRPVRIPAASREKLLGLYVADPPTGKRE